MTKMPSRPKLISFASTIEPGEFQMLILVERLTAENQHRIFVEGLEQRLAILGRDRAGQIEIADFGGKRRRDRIDGDGHDLPPAWAGAASAASMAW